MFTIEQVRKTFTDFAPRYDATHAWRLLKRREARLALGVQPGDRLIEIACGTGLNFPHLHRLVPLLKAHAKELEFVPYQKL